MDTADISYRVADFLKQHAPFRAIDDADLLALTARGRVRFHEPNEYILWQGEPHKPHVFVIQQGTVSLWDESDGGATLRDVRGAGDLLGLERYHGARACLHSARSESDVVIYAFPASDFETHALTYPHVAKFVEAEGRLTADYQPVDAPDEPHATLVHQMAGTAALPTCSLDATLADVAAQLAASRFDAVAMLDRDRRVRAVVTRDTVLRWVAQGAGDSSGPVPDVARERPVVVGLRASVADGVLAMGETDAGVLAVTTDGTPEGSLQALVTSHDLAPLFGERPVELLRQVRLAGSARELRELNRRWRAFLREALTGAATVEWPARFTHLFDSAIVARMVALGGGAGHGCWCFCGSSGRAESLTKLSPYLLLVLDDAEPEAQARRTFLGVLELMEECDYLARTDLPHEPAFYVAALSEWTTRYTSWITDPIMQRTYRSRALFDLRPVHGPRSLWSAIEAAITATADRNFVEVLAHDCLTSLPPLTFFQDAVVDTGGEHSTTFRLESSALRPLVDVGRVFGMAAGQAVGQSTLERFATARRLLPEHEAIFREASDTFRIVLWQQGRVGISQGTRGSDLPPAMLSRYDRQVLKSGFRSILRLLEFTADREWLRNL